MALTFDAKKNFAYSVIAVAPVSATAGTSLQVAPGDGTKFPAAPFNAVIWPTAVQPTTANAEVVRVTAKAVDTFTITRTQESSNSRSVILNDQIMVGPTAKTLTDIEGSFTTASVLTLPIGTLAMWLTGSIPTGWLLLNGQTVSRATYATLFALWSTTFGAGDGISTFTLPDFRQRIPIGLTSSAPLNVLGATSGSWDHTHGPGTLTVANHGHGPGTLQVTSHDHTSGTLTVASHTHGAGTLTVAGHTHDGGTLSTSNDGSHSHTGTTDSGGDHTHTIGGVATDSADQNFDGSTGSFVDNINGSTDSGGSHTHTFTTSSDGTHSHSVNFGNTGSSSPAVNAGTTGSTAPSVTGGSTGASAPLLGGGTSAGATPAVGSGVTASANPPVFVVNFIVRATNEV